MHGPAAEDVHEYEDEHVHEDVYVYVHEDEHVRGEPAGPPFEGRG